MNRFLLVLLMVAAALGPAAGAAAAQENNTTAPAPATTSTPTPTPTPAPNGTDCSQHIDSVVSLCDSDLNGDVATIVLRSSRTTQVVLTDAAAVMQGGEVRQESFTLKGDQLSTIKFRVTIYKGRAAVTVKTSRVLWGIPLRENTSLIGGPWSQTDAQVAALGGALSVSIVSVVLVWRRVTGASDDPERIG